MIPAANLPPSALSLLTKEPAAELGEGMPTESPFSALLEAEIGDGLGNRAALQAPEVAVAAPDLVAFTPLAIRPGGKPDGNILPDLPPLAGLAAQARAGELVPLGEDMAADKADAPAQTGSEPPAPEPAVPDITFALLPPIVTVLTPPPVPEPATDTSRQPQAMTRSEAALPAARRPEPLPALAAAQPVPAAEQQPAPPSPLAQAIILPISLPGIATGGPALRQAAIRTAIVIPAADQSETAPLVADQAATPATPQPVAAAISPRARPALREPGTEAAARPEASPAKEAARPQAALPSAQAAPEPAALAQPIQAAAPAVSAPVIPPPAAQHDFAALIDRLVEARQAAQTSLSMQTVTAAIQHAEFGQVSLQFRHDAEGLSVALTGADPDLARAVQIAAPGAATSAQTGSNAESSGAPPRQDGASQAQAQTQQQRGGSAQRFADDSRASANPSPRQRSQDDPDQRSGIFA